MSDLQDTMMPVSCALSADVDRARCFENTGDYHVPKLHGELDVAGDSARFRRAGGQRTFASSRSVKRCSSSTLSRSQARCCPSACADDSFESLFDRCADPVTRFRRVTSVMHHNLGLSSHAHSTARNSQFEHSRATVMHGRVSLNSSNSRGDTEAGGQRFCVQGGIKSLSTSARTGVRRSAGSYTAGAFKVA